MSLDNSENNLETLQSQLGVNQLEHYQLISLKNKILVNLFFVSVLLIVSLFFVFALLNISNIRFISSTTFYIIHELSLPLILVNVFVILSLLNSLKNNIFFYIDVKNAIKFNSDAIYDAQKFISTGFDFKYNEIIKEAITPNNSGTRYAAE